MLVSNISPAAETPISGVMPVSFDVTDSEIARIDAYFPSSGAVEAVWDGLKFTPFYSALSSRSAITDGYRYTVRRYSPWPAAVSFEINDYAPGGAVTIIAGDGLTDTSGTFSVNADPDGSIAVTVDGVKVGVLATDAQHGVRGGGTQHANAIAGGAAGFMSGADKTKADFITISEAVNLDVLGAVPANKVIGRITGTGDAELIECTAAGRALLDDADATAQRATLGLGTLATQNGTFSGNCSGTNTGDQTITLTGDVTGSGTGSFACTIGAGKVTTAMLANGTAGQIPTWDAAGVAANVATGTAGHVLTSNGAGAAPTFQGPVLNAGTLNASVIEFNGALGSMHKYTVAGAGPYSISILNPVDGAAYNLIIVNTAGATLTLNAKFLTFPSAQVPAAAAASRTLISALYDSVLDVFHTSLATR